MIVAKRFSGPHFRMAEIVPVVDWCGLLSVESLCSRLVWPRVFITTLWLHCPLNLEFQMTNSSLRFEFLWPKYCPIWYHAACSAVAELLWSAMGWPGPLCPVAELLPGLQTPIAGLFHVLKTPMAKRLPALAGCGLC